MKQFTTRRVTAGVLLVLLASVQIVFAGGRKESPEPNGDGISVEGTADGADSPRRETVPTTIRAAALRGPSGFGMIRLFQYPPELGDDLDLELGVVASPDLMVSRILSGEMDIAVLPTNVAAKLFSKGVPYPIVAITGYGMLYLITRDTELDSWDDLAGKTISNTAKGATPEYVLEYLLHGNGLEPGRDVNVDFSLNHVELAQAFIAGRVEYAVLPEPFVTKALLAVPEARVAFNLQREWALVRQSNHDGAEESAAEDVPDNGGEAEAALDEPDTEEPDAGAPSRSTAEDGFGDGENRIVGTSYPITSLVVKRSLLVQHPGAVRTFLDAYIDSIAWVNANHEAAGLLIETYGFGMTAIEAAAAIPRCNIEYIPAPNARGIVEEFLSVLLSHDPDSIGGSLPSDAFYAAPEGE